MDIPCASRSTEDVNCTEQSFRVSSAEHTGQVITPDFVFVI
jgi:hypothetical protein